MTQLETDWRAFRGLADSAEAEPESQPIKYRNTARGPQQLCTRHEPEPGEVQMQFFLRSEAARLGIGITGVFNRITRGKYPKLQIRRVNKRVVFVRNPE